jgi:hypothetical protein
MRSQKPPSVIPGAITVGIPTIESLGMPGKSGCRATHFKNRDIQERPFVL